MASDRGSQSIARQACDACRVRKRRCELPVLNRNSSAKSPSSEIDSGVSSFSNVIPARIENEDGGRSRQCKRCADLDVPCTFLLPIAARGPRKKDRSARAAKASTPSGSGASPRGASTLGLSSIPSPNASINMMDSPRTTTNDHRQYMQEENTSTSPSFMNHSSPQSVFSNPPAHSPFGTLIPTDSLCSRVLLHRIMSDYLQHLYPLIPVVHRPSFLKDLEKGRELYDKDFLGLVVALSAATIGTMPRKFNEYRNSSTTPLRFNTRTEMINHCYDILLGLRGADYFDEINFNKWASSYLMQISFFQIGQHNRHRMIDVEGIQLARLLNFHQISSYEGLDCIQTQLRKKAFWLTFYGYVHSQLQNLRKEKLTYLDDGILSTINLEELMPVEVDDEMIHENYILPQPEKVLSLTTGFNVSSRVFWASLISLDPPDSPAAKENLCNCVRSKNSNLQLKHLHERLHDLRYMLDAVPPELKQWATGREDEAEDLDMFTRRQQKVLRSQYESMRANIHVSHLWLQSIIADQIDALQHCEPIVDSMDLVSPGSKESWAEREDTCRQLLHVLHGIPEVYLEPNGHHLTYKVRDVAVTLLACPFEPQHEVSRRAFAYLREFTEILSRLDGSETINTLSLQSWVDTGRTIPAGV